MARITVEDCLENIPNRFELVMVAAKRARQLDIGGETPHLPWEGDKPTVMALREIADGYVGVNILENKPAVLLTHKTDISDTASGESGEAV